MLGQTPADGIDLVCLEMPVEEIFYRFVHYREFDVSEMSFAKFAAIMAGPEPDIIGLPVFPSRMFRQSSLYVLEDSPLQSASDLAGKRIGLPEWAQTAQVWVRGWLQHQVKLDLTQISWLQAGVNQAGRKEKVTLQLPKGISLTPRPETSLSALLQNGEIDAISTAHPPTEFGTGNIRRLLRSTQKEEEAYFAETGLFPIMHVIAIRRPVYERHPWIAGNLYKAFNEARSRSIARSLEYTASRFPIPWSSETASERQSRWGGPAFIYGVDANRSALEAFLGYAYEQGVTRQLLDTSDIFARETLGEFRI